MTLIDRVGKMIARWLRAFAKRYPGRPTLTGYTNYQRVDRFNRVWPWSWRPTKR